MTEPLKLTPRLSAAQQALVGTPKARRLVRFQANQALRRIGGADRAEAEALGNEALVIAVRRYRPGKQSFESYASDFVRGHIIRQLLRERAAVPSIDAFLRVLEAGRAEHRSSAERLEDAAASRAEARLRARRRQTLMVVEMLLQASQVETRTPEVILIARQERTRLWQAIELALTRLAPERSEALRLRLSEMSLPQIARALDVSTRTAHRYLDDALVHVHHAIESAGLVTLPNE